MLSSPRSLCWFPVVGLLACVGTPDGGAGSGTGGGSAAGGGGGAAAVGGGAGGNGGGNGSGNGGSKGGSGGGGGGGTGGAPADAGGGTGAGGARDAGGDLASAGGGADGGGTSTALCPPTALVCDDFEDGVLDGWASMPAGGTIGIDSTHATSGRNALSITIPGNQHGGFIERHGAPLFPLPNNALYGRLMVYFDSVPDGHSDIVRGAPTSGGTPWYNVGEQHGQILLNYYNGAATDCWARPNPVRPIAAKTWMCWEWSVNAAQNQMVFWIDGQLSRTVNMTGDGCVTGGNQTWAAPQFGSIRVGEYIAEISATPTRIWIDDVAIGTQGRIGCPAAAAP